MELSTENSTKSSTDRRNLQRASPLLLALSDIKIAHSVFAMPFAMLAAVMAADRWIVTGPNGPYQFFASGRRINWPELSGQLALIFGCMVFARTWAMLINRLADAEYDESNPRTSRRAIASGALSKSRAGALAAGAAAGFVITCVGFLIFYGNEIPAILSLPVLGWIALYSFTKRFTWACHLFLGGALAASPIAAALAVAPSQFIGLFEYFQPDGTSLGDGAELRQAILLLSAFVLFWVAGFDIAYALQDIDFDRRAGLHSIPARLGARGALWVSRAFHAAAFGLLFLAARADPRFGPIFLAAVIAVGVLLVYEHIVLARRGVAGIPIAFFTVNGVVSCLLGAAGIADVLI